jgi:hypothetical protein
VRLLNKRKKPEGGQAKSMGPSVNTSAQDQRKLAARNDDIGTGSEQVLPADFRRSAQQRMSQERGNQRVLSGASKGSRGGGSGKSVGSRGLSAGRSGRSGGVGYQAGHQLGQVSAHAGGKKDSINLNGDQQSQQVVMNTQNQGDMLGIHQYDQIEERLSQEESYRNSTEKAVHNKPYSKNDKMHKRNLIPQAQSSEDLNSYKNRNLIESLNKTSKNITQLLKDENEIFGNIKKSAKNRKHQLGITPSSSVGGPLGLFGLSSATL